MTQLTAKERYERESIGRKTIREYNPLRDLLLTIEITDKCSLECAHCFASASPRNNTFLDAKVLEDQADEFVRLFENYPPRTKYAEVTKWCLTEKAKKEGNLTPEKIKEIEDSTLIGENASQSSIRITGGDAFLHPHLYDILKTFSSREDKIKSKGIDVETNGWWAVDDDKTREVITQLKESGAKCLSMTNDYWHSLKSPFPNQEYGERIKTIAQDLKFNFRYITVGLPVIEGDNWISRAAPIGRARELDEKYWERISFGGCRVGPSPTALPAAYVKTDEITILPNGNVFLCNSGRDFKHATLSVGNIYKDSLNKIINSKNNPIVNLLDEKGPRGITELVGMDIEEHYRLLDKMTPCGLCHEMMRIHGEKLIECVN